MAENDLIKRIEALELEMSGLRRQLGYLPVRHGSGGGGDVLPPGGKKFDVLMKIDDFGTNGWERVRFHE